MMHVVDEVAEAKARLRDYVARGGHGAAPADGRKRGWLLRDISTVVAEADRLAGQTPPPPKRSWDNVWGLFDRRKQRG